MYGLFFGNRKSVAKTIIKVSLATVNSHLPFFFRSSPMAIITKSLPCIHNSNIFNHRSVIYRKKIWLNYKNVDARSFKDFFSALFSWCTAILRVTFQIFSEVFQDHRSVFICSSLNEIKIGITVFKCETPRIKAAELNCKQFTWSTTSKKRPLLTVTRMSGLFGKSWTVLMIGLNLSGAVMQAMRTLL